jgi:hypothetical protein
MPILSAQARRQIGEKSGEHRLTTGLGKDGSGWHHMLETEGMRAGDEIEVEELSTRNAFGAEFSKGIPGRVGHEPGCIEHGDGLAGVDQPRELSGRE